MDHSTVSLLLKQNVQGYQETDTQVRVFVNRKVKMSSIHRMIRDPLSPWEKSDIIPKTVVSKKYHKPTDVIEIGTVKAQYDSAKYRPVRGGCQIAPSDRTQYGTGGLVVDFLSYKGLKLISGWSSFIPWLRRIGVTLTNHPALITNTHVVSGTKEVLQPITGSKIGTVLYKSDLDAGRDVALVQLSSDAIYEQIKGGAAKGFRDAKVEESVHKYGARTGYTSGTLKYKGVTIIVNYPDKTRTLHDVDLYTYMSNKGDSGSVILSTEDNHAVGLIFAGSTKYTIAHPISQVIQELGGIMLPE